MIDDLICLANELDEEGLFLEANYLDLIIKQATSGEKSYREQKQDDIIDLILKLSLYEARRPFSISDDDKKRIKERIKNSISDTLNAVINDAIGECAEAPRVSETSFEEELNQEDLDIGYMPAGPGLL